ncbi:MAG: endonuclease/exonuclease/phosphatase family protein, partial [Woeseiaceae bacterium]
MAGDVSTAARELNAHDFSVVNWNIQKGRDPDWVRDLADVHAEPDLLIVQEAAPHYEAWETLVPGHYHSFAEGFGLSPKPSGVMTLSSAQPLTECDLVSLEPWFGTRKATLITEYGLTNTDRTLLVVNIHGINFTFGIRDLENQFQRAREIIAAHKGPVLFSGDFNTWRGKRAQML